MGVHGVDRAEAGHRTIPRSIPPLAKSAAPVALQQSRILRMTPQDRQATGEKQDRPDLTIGNRPCHRPASPPIT